MQETRTYQERSRAFLVKAREELEAGDFEQASEKAWGAAALMVKAVAQQRGLPHRAHPLLSTLVDDLADETEEEELRRLYAVAEGLHTNFYEDRYRARALRRRLPDVELFVEKMAAILESGP